MSGGTTLRRTKIVCTLGPATASPDGVAALLEAGADVFRLNFSHGDRESHRRTIHMVREVARERGREVAILQDLAGPKIRLGELPGGERDLTTGGRVDLVPTGGDVGPDDLPVAYPYLLEDVHEGERILLADGLIELKVVERGADRLRCEVVVGDRVASHKGVNLPGTTLRVPSFTDKDRDDLAVGLEEAVDLVALSFVRHERDIEPVREMMAGRPNPPLVIAKLEKPQAIERLEAILAAVDGVMVARGDLGVEMPVEQVPLVQKRVISETRRAGKPVITATQMLRSMVTSPRPLRAEASDVANAVLDGTDAVMLSEETAIGQYPGEAVRVLDRIARVVEPTLDWDAILREPISPVLPRTAAALARSAGRLARDVEAAAIVAFTVSGSTARLIAHLRPGMPVLGLTPSLAVARQLALSWGVVPVVTDVLGSGDLMLETANRWVLKAGLAAPGDRVVVTAGVPFGVRGTTNLAMVLEVEAGSA